MQLLAFDEHDPSKHVTGVEPAHTGVKTAAQSAGESAHCPFSHVTTGQTKELPPQSAPVQDGHIAADPTQDLSAQRYGSISSHINDGGHDPHTLHSPFAQRSGVDKGHPLTAEQFPMVVAHFPSGHRTNPDPHSVLLEHEPGFDAHVPSAHKVGAFDGHPLELGQSDSDATHSPFQHLTSPLVRQPLLDACCELAQSVAAFTTHKPFSQRSAAFWGQPLSTGHDDWSKAHTPVSTQRCGSDDGQNIVEPGTPS